MKVFLMVSFIVLALSNSQASVSPYNLCLDEAYQKYEKSVSMADHKRERQERLCYRYPLGEAFSQCLRRVGKTFTQEKKLSKEGLVKSKKSCLSFL